MFGVISAHAAEAQKERKLAECNFETEKVLVLYKAIYEGGRLGKADDDYFAELSQQKMHTQNAEQRKSVEKMMTEQIH